MEVFDLIRQQSEYMKSVIPLIASENVTSKFVRECYLSDFGHRYAMGDVEKRIYSGCNIIDRLEELAIKYTKELFGCEHANVKPISGTIANLAVYRALTECGDKILALPVKCGGHFSFHDSANVRCLRTVEMPFDPSEFNIDLDNAKKKIIEERPKLVILGASVFLFSHPVKELVEVAHEVGARVMYDGSHVLGLIAGKEFQDPIKEGADVVTASTHKTFPGPQRAVIMCKEELAEMIDYGVMPCVVSNHHIHSLAGYAMACIEMLEFGRDYARQIVRNAKALAEELYNLGYNVLCPHLEFTKSHQVVVDVGNGCEVVGKLEKANILTNPCLLPWDDDKASGIRIGVQEVTRLGMKEDEMREIARFIDMALKDKKPIKDIKNEIKEFKSNFLTVKYTFEEHPAY
ncbi:serine hydroxymethyltransferase [Archaeoglobus profundus]|uniref:Glycine hydroxymethyltransferase n=1 Tax=Archaeoglobus profundus (strain DSM 5631 / JCM 9629 / NBRC 100127 / Av18) TaxID=572546 RepID=D2RET9_ARCPA|nr:serine hydroxymethyltransferase [Archaeoglobus profundus]ADB58633.1 Glycine hydroxymethyltransferase [Archaeoglobus profundus DSM 5631]